MATRHEYYITGDDHAYGVWGVNWYAQTFTPSTSHTVVSVKLELYRVGEPGDITVSIRNTTSDLPSGEDLCSGTTSANTLTTGSSGEWREITLGSGTALTASTKYAIVVRCTGGDGSTKYLMWRVDTSSGAYTDGNYCNSSNSGSSWTETDGYDFMFEEWGGEAASVTTQACTDVAETTATGNGTIVSLGGAAVTQHGHCWGASENPTTADSKTTKGTGYLGTFISSITGLTGGQTYHTRAYITNSQGTFYGADVTFATFATDTPTVETRDCTALTGTTATGVGIIWDIGGSAVTEHGHCWHTSVNPTTSHSKTTNGAGSFGSFTSAITGLSATTSYYIRAYATNTAGTAYGNNVRIIAGTSGSELAGPIAVVQGRLHYVDKYGVEKYIEGTPV